MPDISVSEWSTCNVIQLPPSGITKVFLIRYPLSSHLFFFPAVECSNSSDHDSTNNITRMSDIDIRDLILERDQLLRDKDRLKRDKNQLIQKRDLLLYQSDHLVREKNQLKRDKDQLKRQKDQLKREKVKLIREKDQLNQDKGQLKCEKDQLLREKDQLLQERDHLVQDNNQLKREKDQLLQENDQLNQDKDQLECEKDRLLQENNQLNQDKDQLECEKDRLLQENNQLNQDKDQLKREKDQLLREKDQLLQERDHLLHQRDRLVQDNNKLKREKDQQIEDNRMLNEKICKPQMGKWVFKIHIFWGSDIGRQSTIDLSNIVIYQPVHGLWCHCGPSYSGSGLQWWFWINMVMMVTMAWTAPWTVVVHAAQSALWFCPVFLLISFARLHLILWHIADPSGPVPLCPVLSRFVISLLVLMRPVLCLFSCRGNHPRLSSRMAVIQVRLLPAFPAD